MTGIPSRLATSLSIVLGVADRLFSPGCDCSCSVAIRLCNSLRSLHQQQELSVSKTHSRSRVRVYSDTQLYHCGKSSLITRRAYIARKQHLLMLTAQTYLLVGWECFWGINTVLHETINVSAAIKPRFYKRASLSHCLTECECVCMV